MINDNIKQQNNIWISININVTIFLDLINLLKSMNFLKANVHLIISN